MVSQNILIINDIKNKLPYEIILNICEFIPIKKKPNTQYQIIGFLIIIIISFYFFYMIGYFITNISSISFILLNIIIGYFIFTLFIFILLIFYYTFLKINNR